MDVERHLADEPVLACPPSATYRFAKFARRNRAAFTTSIVVLAAILVGTVVSVTQAIRATRAERQATAQFQEAQEARDAEAAQRHIAEQQRQQAEENLKRARQARKARRANPEGGPAEPGKGASPPVGYAIDPNRTLSALSLIHI